MNVIVIGLWLYYYLYYYIISPQWTRTVNMVISLWLTLSLHTEERVWKIYNLNNFYDKHLNLGMWFLSDWLDQTNNYSANREKGKTLHITTSSSVNFQRVFLPPVTSSWHLFHESRGCCQMLETLNVIKDKNELRHCHWQYIFSSFSLLWSRFASLWFDLSHVLRRT